MFQEWKLKCFHLSGIEMINTPQQGTHRARMAAYWSFCLPTIQKPLGESLGMRSDQC
jgi:hypothetical protein